MKITRFTLINTFLGLLLISIFSLLITSCNKDNSVQNQEMTDNQYIQSVITGGYNTGNTVEDNLSAQEIKDLDNGGAVKDNDNGPDNIIDSLYKWEEKSSM